MILVSNHIFGHEESEFLFCGAENPKNFKMAAFSSNKINFRGSFATTFAAVAEWGCVGDVVPVF